MLLLLLAPHHLSLLTAYHQWHEKAVQQLTYAWRRLRAALMSASHRHKQHDEDACGLRVLLLLKWPAIINACRSVFVTFIARTYSWSKKKREKIKNKPRHCNAPTGRLKRQILGKYVFVFSLVALPPYGSWVIAALWVQLPEDYLCAWVFPGIIFFIFSSYCCAHLPATARDGSIKY